MDSNPGTPMVSTLILRHHFDDEGIDQDYDCDAKRTQILKAGGLNATPNKTNFYTAMATFSWWASLKDTVVSLPGQPVQLFKEVAWFGIQEWY